MGFATYLECFRNYYLQKRFADHFDTYCRGLSDNLWFYLGNHMTCSKDEHTESDWKMQSAKKHRPILPVTLISIISITITAILLLLGFLFCGSSETTEKISASSVKGLQISISRVSRERDVLLIYYRLRFLENGSLSRLYNIVPIINDSEHKSTRAWILTNDEFFDVYFFDSTGQEIASDVVYIGLGNDFVLGISETWESKFEVRYPAHTSFMAIQLQNSALKTNRIPIPNP